MKNSFLLLALATGFAFAAASGCNKVDSAKMEPEDAGDVLFPEDGSPVWRFHAIHWPDETNILTEVFPVAPARPPFDLIGTWNLPIGDFLIRTRVIEEGIQPIVELWECSRPDRDIGQLFIDWTPGRTEIDTIIEPDSASASRLALDFWSWETTMGGNIGPGMINADFGSAPVFASVCGQSVHPFALSYSSSNGVLGVSTWSDPACVASYPVFRAEDSPNRSEDGKAAPRATIEKELKSFCTPDATLRNVPLGEIVDLVGQVFRSESIRAGEPTRSSTEGGFVYFLPFFEGRSDGPDPGRLIECSGQGNLAERFASDPRISVYVPDADAWTLLERIATAGNCELSVVDGGVKIVSAPAAPNLERRPD